MTRDYIMYPLIIWLLIGSTNEVNWNKELSTQIHKLQPHQVFVLGINKNPQLKITEKIPTWSANLVDIEAKLQFWKQLSAFENPRKTTFFILSRTSRIDEDSFFIRSNLTSLFTVVNRISGVRTRPKCLILHFSEKAFNYENLLRKLWSERFLDVSVLEILELESSKVQFIENRVEIPNLHFWNPFMKTYTKKIYSRKTKLFPSKLGNLNGHQIKVGVYDYFPFLNVSADKEGRVLSVTGLATKLPETLSKKMNFALFQDGTYRREAGRFDYDKEMTTGVFRQLVYNEIQLIGLEVAIIGPNESNVFERTTITGYTDFCAMLPILPAESTILVVTNEFLAACIFIICLFILTWGVSRLLKFNPQFWPLMYIVQLVIGAPLPQAPRKFEERIIIASIYLSSTVYLSWICIAMTITVLETKQEIEFAKIADMLDYNLTCSFPTETSYILSKSFNPDNEQLFQKYSVSTSEKCVAGLLNYQNVSCSMIKELADYFIQKHRGRNGEPLMKIVEQRMINSVRALKLEPGTPYVDRFDKLIFRLQNAGIFRKWYDLAATSFPKFSNLQTEDLAESMRVQYQIFVVPVIGLVLSLGVFIGEVIVSKVISQR